MFVQAAVLGWCWSLRRTVGRGRWSLAFPHVLSSASPLPAPPLVTWVRNVHVISSSFPPGGVLRLSLLLLQAVAAPPVCSFRVVSV